MARTKYYSNAKINRRKEAFVTYIELLLFFSGVISFGQTYNTYKMDMFDHSDYALSIFMLSFIILTISFIVIKIIRKIAKRFKSIPMDLSIIDYMNGSKFEEWLYCLFEKEGYNVKLIGGSYDFGGDLILTKNGKKYVVQVKRYSDKVGIKAIQEVIGAKVYYNADEAIVATNSFFTKSAKSLAKKANVSLIDRNDLIRLMKKYKK